MLQRELRLSFVVTACLRTVCRPPSSQIVHSQTGLAWTVALPPNWFDPTVRTGPLPPLLLELTLGCPQVQLIRFDAKNKNQQFCFY